MRGEAWEVWGKVRGDVRGVKKCGGSVGVGMEGVGKCVGRGGGEKKFGERHGGEWEKIREMWGV